MCPLTKGHWPHGSLSRPIHDLVHCREYILYDDKLNLTCVVFVQLHAPALFDGVSKLSWFEFNLAIWVIGSVEDVVDVLGSSACTGCCVCKVRNATKENLSLPQKFCP